MFIPKPIWDYYYLLINLADKIVVSMIVLNQEHVFIVIKQSYHMAVK